MGENKKGGKEKRRKKIKARTLASPSLSLERNETNQRRDEERQKTKGRREREREGEGGDIQFGTPSTKVMSSTEAKFKERDSDPNPFSPHDVENPDRRVCLRTLNDRVRKREEERERGGEEERRGEERGRGEYYRKTGTTDPLPLISTKSSTRVSWVFFAH